MTPTHFLYAAYKKRSNKHCIVAYNYIMEQLTSRFHKVINQAMDKKAIASHKKFIKGTRKSKYQIAPPDVHRRNVVERAIRTFKSHFLAILDGVNPTFTINMSDKLLPQTEMTLNLMPQATLNLRILAREYFNGTFNFSATPLGPMDSRVIFYTKTGNRKSWDQRDREGSVWAPALIIIVVFC